MDPILLSAIFTFLASIPAAAVAYFVAARRFSGKINTTEAVDLWKESTSIREWSRDRIRELQEENAALRRQAEADRKDCLEQIAELHARIATLEDR